jgi:hypothetical protein
MVNEFIPVPVSARPPSSVAVGDFMMATRTKKHEVLLYPIAVVSVYTMCDVTTATAFQFLSTYLTYTAATFEDVVGELPPAVAFVAQILPLSPFPLLYPLFDDTLGAFFLPPRLFSPLNDALNQFILFADCIPPPASVDRNSRDKRVF